MLFVILSYVIQLALVVHVLKTGRNIAWVFILLFFPAIGGIAYFIVELLPELTGSRTARNLGRSVTRAVNPDKDLQDAAQRLAVADTVQNAIRLAEECLDKGRYAEARDLYAARLKGVHADDPALLHGLARAQFGLGEYAAVIEALDKLREANPGYRSPEAHLLYARAQDESGHRPQAEEEYEALCGYYPGPEPFVRLGQLLKADGRTDRARELFERVVDESRIAGKHYNSLHKEWVALAKRELDG
ncbi:MAG TPA: tetratricopeptide repeat protein [Steroidobacteraceae bacterium]